jgi:hypothetical protein
MLVSSSFRARAWPQQGRRKQAKPGQLQHGGLEGQPPRAPIISVIHPSSGRTSDQMRAWVAGTWAVRSSPSRSYQHVRYTPLPRTRCSIRRANAGCCPTQPTVDPPPLHIKLSPKPRSAARLACASGQRSFSCQGSTFVMLKGL